MSVATELTRIQTAKADIKASIEAKGVTVPSDALIDTYDTYIGQISGGGGAATPSNLSDWTYDSFGKITSAVIRNGVTSLNYDNGFNGCKSLTSITIPDSVTSIISDAFNGCTSLTSVTIGSGVTSIGDYAFSGCSVLTSINIPNSVTSIGNGAFSNCTGLTSITIPDSVTSIGNAFYDCTGLTSVTIGSGITSIGGGAFAGSGLTNITINATTPPSAGSSTYGIFANTPIGDGLGWIYVPEESVDLYKASSSFSAYSSHIVSIGGCSGKLCGIDIDGNDFLIINDDEDVILGMSDHISDYNPIEATVGNMIEIIEEQAFSGCSSLTTVTIPNSVTSIGNNAFDGCESLGSVTINATTPPTLGTNAFDNTSPSLVIYVPAESFGEYMAAENWGNYTIEAIPSE